MSFSLYSQPGKLTEAFKYFIQGMGYSKYLIIIYYASISFTLDNIFHIYLAF